jgi:hypothetical protein
MQGHDGRACRSFPVECVGEMPRDTGREVWKADDIISELVDNIAYTRRHAEKKNKPQMDTTV